MLAALLSCASGCAVQLASGVNPIRSPYAGSIDLAGRLIGTRASGPYAGADLVAAYTRDRDFVSRHVLLSAGYRLIAPRLSFELGAELGVGEPATERWRSTQLYLGVAPSLLFRIYGQQDSTLGYSLVSLLADLVLSLRGGVWQRPAGAGAGELVDGALLVGIRLSAISDVSVSNNRNWEP